ncbi:MAG: DNA ligase D [Pseudomonadota bacterium]|nr:DNA ligase D [Pseudomonadota bacterium]
MGLTRYREKRDFTRTTEPAGKGDAARTAQPPTRRFVVQKHDATRLHFDLRLELDGVLLCWAVPKGPSLDPADKRLAVHTEDHPLEYLDFEGAIPAGEYGGGPMMLWDQGTWTPDEDPRAGHAQGKLKFHLHGHRLRGGWALVRTRSAQEEKEAWLLVKEVDASVATPGDALVATRLTSIRTRRTMEDILADRDPVIPDAPRSPLPDFVPPALATAVDHPPLGGAWRHEMKLDGYRALVRVEGRPGARTVRILTRSGLDWTDRFGPIARAAETLPVTAALLDGEIVVLDAEGRSDFGALVGALEQGRPERQLYYAFDLLHLDGHDLRGLPLSRRGELLSEVVIDARPPIRLLEHIDGDGALFFQAACEHGLEGIVSKRPDAPYRSGRGRAWLKVRCDLRQEMVVVGWTDPGGGRTALGALLLAYREGDTWRFAGRVGTGFDEATLTGLLARLEPMARRTPPVVDPPTGSEARGCHWTEPRLVAEVKYTGWTPYQRLRHPVFLGLREDKRPEDVRLEVPMAEEEAEKGDEPDAPATSAPTRAGDRATKRALVVALTNPDRVFWPDVGVTKRDLAAWLDAVADRMLPEIARRPLTLVRCPNGQDAGCFYQRHVTEGLPPGTRGVVVPGHGDDQPYLWVENRAGLVGLAQIGALEIHPWGVRIDDLDRPDRLVFDLDPGPRVRWDRLAEAATGVRDRLSALGLASFAKVTGGKGIHVVVPLRPHAPWEVAKPFSRMVAEALAKADPERLTAKMAKTQREGRIYVDWLRNTSTSTAVAAWSPRARPYAPVAVPVAWEDLAGVGRGDHFRLRDLLGALPPDPWGPLDAVDQRLDEAVLRRLGA